MSHGVSSPVATVRTSTCRSQRVVSGHDASTRRYGLPLRQRRSNNTEAALFAYETSWMRRSELTRCTRT